MKGCIHGIADYQYATWWICRSCLRWFELKQPRSPASKPSTARPPYHFEEITHARGHASHRGTSNPQDGG